MLRVFVLCATIIYIVGCVFSAEPTVFISHHRLRYTHELLTVSVTEKCRTGLGEGCKFN